MTLHRAYSSSNVAAQVRVYMHSLGIVKLFDASDLR